MRGSWIAMLAFAAIGCSDAALKTFNAAPVAAITSHADGDERLEQAETELRGTASDPDHDASELLTTWRVNDEIVCEDVVPEDDGTSRCLTSLATGSITISFEVSDPGNATGSDAVSFTVTPNSPPDVTLTDPFAGNRYYADESIEFKGRAVDDEDGFDVLEVKMESDIQGVIELNTDLDTDGRFSDFGRLEEGTHIITLTATDSGGKTGRDQEEIVVLPGNDPPTIESVLISPNPAYASDALTCSYLGFSDPDDDADASTIAWAINGTSISGGTILTGGYTAGDTVTCTVTPNDGTQDGEALSDSIVIRNQAPELVSVAITPNTGITTTTALRCTATAEDADGEEPTLTYAWDIDGAAVGEGDLLALTDTGAVRGETVTCTATATDASGDTGVGTDSVIVGNTPPVILSVTISPDPAYTDSRLTAFVANDDADDDIVTEAYAWSVNGEPVEVTADGVLDGAIHFDKGDEVTVTVTPTDGMDEGEPRTSATLTIANSPPAAPTVRIVEGELTGCETGWSASDDGTRCFQVFDAVVAWPTALANCEAMGGTLATIESEADNELIYSLSGGLDGESIWIGFNDRGVEGIWEWTSGSEATYTRWRSPEPNGGSSENCGEMYHMGDYPGASEFQGFWNDYTCESAGHSGGYACEKAQSTEGLTCSVEDASTDADGDAVTYTFEWDFEGTAYTDTDSSTFAGDTVPGYALSADGTWTCTVTPNDGEEDGEPGTATYEDLIPILPECTSLYFDGDTDVIVPASEDFVDFRVGLTIESWVKWDGHDGHDWYPIATIGWGGDGSAARFFLAVSGEEGSACSGVSDPGYLHLEVQTRPSLGACISSTRRLEVGIWHHVAAVFDAGEARIYIDGNLERTASAPDDLLRDVGPTPLKIGRVDAGAGSKFLGSMSNVRYSSAAQYDGNFVPDWPLEAHGDTVGLWSFEEGHTDDVSGNGHHGSLTGGTWMEECPNIYDGCWTASYDTSTYVFCSDRLSRDDAEAECAALGMDLVKITRGSENDFVFSEAVDIGGWGHPGPWIGVQDADLDGTFAWNDGSSLGYTEWCSAHPIDPGSRAYVHMEVSLGESPCWAANGSSETEELPYVCEAIEP